jgi:hypothetical protein
MHWAETMNRRQFLQTGAGAALSTMLLRPAVRAAAPMELPPAHAACVQARRCRIVMQYDANDILWNYWDSHPGQKPPFPPFRDALFTYVDEPGSQVDGIAWDIGGSPLASPYPSRILPAVFHPLIRQWLDQGIDWVEQLVAATRSRRLEVFWNHRICEVECLPNGGVSRVPQPLKVAHPDWVLPATWWPQGTWNLAAPGLREYQVSVLRELAERYDLDGIQIDYSRHLPCLPVGHQWELRDQVTIFMRQLRRMTLEVAQRRGRPLLLAAKVPQTVGGCHIDGFDLQSWGEQNLVDVLTLGSRSMDVDVEGVRTAVGPRVQLQPCFDDHHASNGYRYMPIEGLRGVFANHLQRGANSVVTFNWSIGPPQVCRSMGAAVGPPSHQLAYHEVGEARTLAGKDKFFSVERRGGYPWSDGFFNRNDTAPLPAILPVAPSRSTFILHLSDPPTNRSELTVRLIVARATRDDAFELWINGRPVTPNRRDPEWKDPQIPPEGQYPHSGSTADYRIDPRQRLLRLDYPVPPDGWHEGPNQIEVRLRPSSHSGARPAPQVEKMEAHLHYGTRRTA